MTSFRKTIDVRRTATARRLRRRWTDDRDLGHMADTVSTESLARYNELLTREAETSQVPADLLRAICWYASGWRHFGDDGRTITSRRPDGTAWGCMQLSDHWHPDAFPAAYTDPASSIRYAATLLAWLHDQAGSWPRATVAFFGHDARAEQSARRVRAYSQSQPWNKRLTSPESTRTPTPPRGPAKGDDLYANLAM